MNGYLRQATAGQVRTIGPFVDDTDFKTLENALAIANTDILLKKNGAASAAKNSGGATADGAGGLYAVTWDATDTATVGELSFSVKVAGALAVFGTYVVLEEAIYDALYASAATGLLPANVTQFGGAAGTFASGRPEVNASHVAGTAQTARDLGAQLDAAVTSRMATFTLPTNFSALSITAGGLVDLTQAAADKVWGTAARTLTAFSFAVDLSATALAAIWDRATSALTTAGSIGKALVDLAGRIVGTLATGTHQPQAGDAFARLGAPAGASVSADVAAVKAETALIVEDTGTTIPASLLLIDNDTSALETRLTAALATTLQAHHLAVGRVVVGAGSTTTSVVLGTVNGAAPSATNDFYNGRVLVFTSGALTLQATSISDYDGTSKAATVVALTGAPAADVTAVLV